MSEEEVTFIHEDESDIHFRLIESNPIWRRYAVSEGELRYLVTRVLNPMNSLPGTSLLESAEKWAAWTNTLESKLVSPILRVEPHAEGVDIYQEMPTGITLNNLVGAVGALKVSAVASILKEIAEGFKVLHEAGRVHRALCPRRIVINTRGEIRLLDFGLVELLEELVGPISFPDLRWEYLFVNPSMTAPEVVKGQGITVQTDIFSLTGIAFYLLTGVRPFVGADAMEVYSLSRTGDTPEIALFRSELSPALGRGVHKGLMSLPLQRFSSVQQLVEALFGSMDRYDPLPEALLVYQKTITDWFLDSRSRTIREPSKLALGKVILQSDESDARKDQLLAVDAVLSAMRSSSEARRTGGQMSKIVLLVAVVFTSLALYFLYFFLNR